MLNPTVLRILSERSVSGSRQERTGQEGDFARVLAAARDALGEGQRAQAATVAQAAAAQAPPPVALARHALAESIRSLEAAEHPKRPARVDIFE